MQLEAVLFALALFFIIPIIIVFSNDNVFFIILSILLLIDALKNIRSFLSGKRYKLTTENSEFQEEFEQLTNIDYKMFSAGMKVARNFVCVIFFIYCLFLIKNTILSFFTLVVVVHWIVESFKIISGTKSLTNYYINNFYSFPKSFFKSIVSIFTLILIFYVTSIKFF